MKSNISMILSFGSIMNMNDAVVSVRGAELQNLNNGFRFRRRIPNQINITI